MRELLLGCGSLKNKRLAIIGVDTEDWVNLTTLDIVETHNPDIVWDLNKRPLPFDDNTFDQVHGYEIFEHLGRQGDAKGFFEEFYEYWRILKPGGRLYATVPSYDSMGAWGDPSHTRIINPMTLTFLSQKAYEEVGKNMMSDFRGIWKGDFERVFSHMDEKTKQFSFILRALKGDLSA